MMKKTLLALALVLAPGSAFAFSDGFVVAKGDGTVVRSTGFTVFHVDSGIYEIDSVNDVHSCTYSVTAGAGDGSTPPIGFATAVGRRELHTAIMIATYDGDGNRADRDFQLIVRC